MEVTQESNKLIGEYFTFWSIVFRTIRDNSRRIQLVPRACRPPRSGRCGAR